MNLRTSARPILRVRRALRVLALTALILPGWLPALCAAADGASADVPADAFEVKEWTLPPTGYARPPFHIKASQASGPPSGALSPKQIRNFYGFGAPANQGGGQVIAIVNAYDDPNLLADVATFTSYFGLAPCNVQKVYASGTKPRANSGWALEMALDVEWACAIAPGARILLVEAATSSIADLVAAVNVALKSGANVVSMSWGGGEFAGETAYDADFSKPGVMFVAASGDSGSGVEYPAASPWVVSVGGTTVSTNANGDHLGEVAWSGSGGGQSAYEAEPFYQRYTSSTAANLPIPYDPTFVRGVPDVAYNADPNTGVAVYSSVRYQNNVGWFKVGGTSVGTPQWAALIAIANASKASVFSTDPNSNTGSPIYNAAVAGYATNFFNITAGSNGTCGVLCNAAPSYDYVTGLGSPQANNIIPMF